MMADNVDSEPKNYKVFYSWQSDLSHPLNRGAINKALELARKKLKVGMLEVDVDSAGRSASTGEESNLKVEIDQATRGLPGSPKIADAIIAKISAADIFVADISTVNLGSRKYRHTPNPNVIFELGFAVATLGWDRIVLVINDAGKKSVQVPFDIQGHRYLSYSLIEDVEDKKAEIDKLGHSLASAIRNIIASKPPRPSELSGKTVEQLRREHDVRALASVFSSISIPALEEHLQSAPEHYKYATSLVVDEFDGVYRSFSFRVHDARLRDTLKEFDAALHQSIPGDGLSLYRDTADPCTERFAHYGEINAQNAHDAAEEIRERLGQGIARLALALNTLLEYVHHSYPEINPVELGQVLGREIADQLRQMRSERGR